MNKLIFIIYTCVAMISCGDEPKSDRKNAFSETPRTKEDSLYKDVMDAHDVAMAKTGKLRRYLADIQARLDSLNKLPSAKLDKNYQQFLIDLQEDLNYADYGMNTWMEEFKMDSASGNKDLRIQYLQSEKEKVTKVKDNILNGLRRADSLFKK
jgi:hypothetical protein